MKFNKFLIVLLISILHLPAYAGTAYYVDCSASQNGDGSYSKPWNSLASVNKHSFNQGDDVYFKKNSKCTLTSDNDRLIIDWSGTSQDEVVVGCYDGDGDFDCGSVPYVDGNRAIIDGQNKYPSTYKSLINISGQSYITLEEIKLQNAGLSGTSVYGLQVYNYSDHINVFDTYIYRCQEGLIYGKVDTGIISRNYFEQAGYPGYVGTGATLAVNGLNELGSTRNITVSYNKLVNCKHEGIGFYKGVVDSVMEYNIVRDVRSYHLYVASSPNNIVRYNMVYESSDRVDKSFSENTYGIAVNIEAWRDKHAFSTENTLVYGNLVAGMNRGISIGCGERFDEDQYDSACSDGTEIYNNTLVDNNYNFTFWDAASDIHNKVFHNISIIEDGKTHSNTYSPGGVTWINNYFDDSVSGNAGTSQLDENIILSKTKGWRSLQPDSLTGMEFKPQVGIVKEMENDLSINDLIASCDFTSSPIEVVLNKVVNGFIVGSWTTNSDSSSLPDQPKNIVLRPMLD
jgi:hypothetical protein